MAPQTSPIVLVYITTPDHNTAETLARLALESRLAACANILGPLTSLFHWEETLEHTQEVALLLKTTPECFEPLRERMVRHHPYACPCIIAIPVTQGHAPFLQWVTSETLAPNPHA